MKIIGMSNVQNEGAHIGRVVRALDQLCNDILILNDRSTDNTVEEVYSAVTRSRLHLLQTPFQIQGFNGVRDKNYLMAHALLHRPDWIISVDGDEELSQEAINSLKTILDKPATQLTVISFKLLTFWNDYNIIRTDGIYNNLHIRRVFSIPSWFYEQHSWFGGYPVGIHCPCVPSIDYTPVEIVLIAPVFHYGYISKEDRIATYKFYQNVDPVNEIEDNYRHIVLGDLPELPTDLVVKHGGPLKLETYLPKAV